MKNLTAFFQNSVPSQNEIDSTVMAALNMSDETGSKSVKSQKDRAADAGLTTRQKVVRDLRGAVDKLGSGSTPKEVLVLIVERALLHIRSEALNTPADMKLIHALADLAHNLPRSIADSKRFDITVLEGELDHLEEALRDHSERRRVSPLTARAAAARS